MNPTLWVLRGQALKTGGDRPPRTIIMDVASLDFYSRGCEPGEKKTSNRHIATKI